MTPDKSNNKVILYIHPSGKSAEAFAGGEMEWFVKNGFVVLAPDLIGTGEMNLSDYQGDAFIGGKSHNIWYSAILIGRSLVGIQVGDVVRLVRMVKKTNETASIYGVARGEITPVLMHAAAFDPSIERIALIEPFSSYQSVVMNHFYNSGFIYGTVPGSLRAYDLPDLMASLAPRKLLVAGITDSLGKSASPDIISDDMDIVRNAYQLRNVNDQLNILMGGSSTTPANLFSQWVK
jgi:hypothetical protein